MAELARMMGRDPRSLYPHIARLPTLRLGRRIYIDLHRLDGSWRPPERTETEPERTAA